jgi:hypothetical protein
MDVDQFWDIVSEACQSDPRISEEWAGRLQTVLMRYKSDDIVEWDHIFDRFAVNAYMTDLIAACCLINLGAGYDGFYYFRCWLIGMGREAYESAIADADTLADRINPSLIAQGIDAEAEIYAAAYNAWKAVTGKSDMDDYPVRTERAKLRDDDWDIDNKAEVQRRLPRLAAMFLD